MRLGRCNLVLELCGLIDIVVYRFQVGTLSHNKISGSCKPRDASYTDRQIRMCINYQLGARKQPRVAYLRHVKLNGITHGKEH